MTALTTTERQRTRRRLLNQAAQSLNFESWAQLETAVINDRIAVTLEYKLRPDKVIHHNCKCQVIETPA